MQKYRRSGAMLVSTILVTMFHHACAQAGGPPLSETLAWMDSTYNDHSQGGGSYGHGDFRTNDTDGRLFNRITGSMAFNGCHVTIRNVEDPNAPLYRSMQSTQIVEFNLRDIDPNSMDLRRFASAGGLRCDLVLDDTPCDVGYEYYSTKNQLPLIDDKSDTIFPQIKGSEHESKSTRKAFSLTIYFDDLKYSSPFNRAFRRAITLCGGKPSPF